MFSSCIFTLLVFFYFIYDSILKTLSSKHKRDPDVPNLTKNWEKFLYCSTYFIHDKILKLFSFLLVRQFLFLFLLDTYHVSTFFSLLLYLSIPTITCSLDFELITYILPFKCKYIPIFYFTKYLVLSKFIFKPYF